MGPGKPSPPKRVFVSFSQQDRTLASDLIRFLATDFDIITGQAQKNRDETRMKIADQIERSQAVVILLTGGPPGVVSSEVAMASSLGKPIIAVASERAEQPEFLKAERLRVVTYTSTEQVREDLVRELNKVIGRGVASLPHRRPERFEAIVRQVFTDAGYSISEPEKRIDVGVDIVASFAPPGWSRQLDFAVECRFSSRPLGLDAIKVAERRVRGLTSVPLLVTNSRLSLSAKALADDLGLWVIEGPALLEMAERVGSSSKIMNALQGELVSVE